MPPSLCGSALAPLQSENALQFFTRIICDGTEYEDDEEGNEEFGPSGSESDHESSSGGESEGEEENKDNELTKSLLTKVKGEKDAGEEEDEDAEGDDDYEPEETEEKEGDDNGREGEDGEGGEEVDEDEDEDDGEEEARVVIQPNPEPFTADKFHLHKPPNFKDLYGRKGRPLQVIVKLANIELTPEKPKYEGGTWHVEGKQVGQSRSASCAPNY
jgi:hypothetical protein